MNLLISDYSNLGFIIHIRDPYFIFIINSSLINSTNHALKAFFIVSWCCCHVSDHVTNMISSHDLSITVLIFFGMEICINTSFF